MLVICGLSLHINRFDWIAADRKMCVVFIQRQIRITFLLQCSMSNVEKNMFTMIHDDMIDS